MTSNKWWIVLAVVWGCGALPEAGATDRVNLWPILYVRGNTTHLLGPIVKLSDDDVAVRPLFAVNTQRHTRIRVLYPLCELNIGHHPNWVFPYFQGEDYRVVFPVYWRYGAPYGEAQRGYHGILPFYSYSRRGDDYTLYAPWPFLQTRRQHDTRSLRVWPLYGRHTAPQHSSGYVAWPLTRWWQHEGIYHESGRYVFPLFFQATSYREDIFLSLPWSYGRHHSSGHAWRMALPFFYHATHPEGRSWVSLPYVRHIDGTASSWCVPPLLSWGAADTGQHRWRAALGLAGRDRGTELNRDYALPLYYRSQTPQRAIFATPLGGWITQPDGRRRWDVYPLLTWLDRQPDATHFWALAPLIRHSQTPAGRVHHVLPFYLKDDVNQRFLSPLYARWQDGPKRTTVVPPLLTRIDRQPEQTDVWTVGGLVHHRSIPHPEKRTGYALPFYYFSGGHTLYTPLYGHNRNGPGAWRYFATPLAGQYTGAYRGNWLLPLYHNQTDRESGDYETHFLLTGKNWRHSTGHGSRIWPFYSYSQTRHGTEHPHQRSALNVLLLAERTRSEHTTTTATGPETTLTHRHYVFPLWHHRRTARRPVDYDHARTTLLLGLYQTRTTQTDNSDYARRRLLWKVWDYERRDGRVEVDAFPFITYDRAPDARRMSFLWRAFRYERDPEGRTLDLLFIPLMRS